jgi:hypothetical protein
VPGEVFLGKHVLAERALQVVLPGRSVVQLHVPQPSDRVLEFHAAVAVLGGVTVVPVVNAIIKELTFICFECSVI